VIVDFVAAIHSVGSPSFKSDGVTGRLTGTCVAWSQPRFDSVKAISPSIAASLTPARPGSFGRFALKDLVALRKGDPGLLAARPDVPGRSQP
jgi:hypothetical protein